MAQIDDGCSRRAIRNGEIRYGQLALLRPASRDAM